MPRVADFSERELVQKLKEILEEPKKTSPPGVIHGIDDDAAVLETSPGKRMVSSCDIMIEGRHFDLNYTSPRDLGYKALAVNVSDMAAMGGTPRWAMVSLALPPETSLDFWEEIYAGMKELASASGVTIVGGDTTSASFLVVDVSILGEVYPYQATYRSTASPGERLLVTGHLGASAAGLSWLQGDNTQGKTEYREVEPLVKAHLRPSPRFAEALVLRELYPGAVIDLSDGLAAGIEGICNASGVGARVSYVSLPCLQETRGWAQKSAFSLEEWLLYGGEDYELLFTASAEKAPYLVDRILKDTGTPVTIIGEVTPSQEGMLLLKEEGRIEKLDPQKYYNHFT